MNIKSLLVGSAALAAVSTGAHAADAIVMPEPEPMDYVRICDVYGAGFFYIPGTETCLAIGGYMRYEIWTGTNFSGWNKRARFTPRFDVRSDTEIGTVRGYAEIELDWDRATNRVDVNAPAGTAGAPAYGVDVQLPHAFIQLVRGSHSWVFGRTHSPYSRFLGYANFGVNDQSIGFRNTSEISYTFNGSNGFGFIFALVEDNDGNFIPDVETGFRFVRGWGHIGLVAVGDFDNTGYGTGAKGSLLLNFGNSGVSMKTQVAFGTFGLAANLGFQAVFTPKFTMYINGGYFSAGNVLSATLGATFTPAPNFQVIPEVRYSSATGIQGFVRLNRNFGLSAGL